MFSETLVLDSNFQTLFELNVAQNNSSGMNITNLSDSCVAHLSTYNIIILYSYT